MVANIEEEISWTNLRKYTYISSEGSHNSNNDKSLIGRKPRRKI